MLTRSLVALSTLLIYLATACSGGDNQPQEPVVPETDTSAYPEDPDMQPKDVAAEATDPSAKTEELPGALTDDPFAANGGKPQDDALANAAPQDDVTLPPADSGGVQGAFDENQPQYEPTPDLLPNVQESVKSTGKGKNKAAKTSKARKGKQKAKVAAAAKPVKVGSTAAVVADADGGGEGEQTMYVKALLLNVRNAPSMKGQVVRRLFGGAMVKVSIEGEYAKLREGEYVRTKYLSDSPTKKTNRSDVQKAWKRSKYKDRWKQP